MAYMIRYLKVEIDRDSLIKQNKQFNSIEYRVYLGGYYDYQ